MQHAPRYSNPTKRRICRSTKEVISQDRQLVPSDPRLASAMRTPERGMRVTVCYSGSRAEDDDAGHDDFKVADGLETGPR